MTKNIINKDIYLCSSGREIGGSDLVFNQCFSVGEEADIAAELVDVPLLKVDEKMAEVTCQTEEKIGVVATSGRTMGPTVCLIKKKAKKMDKM